MAKEPVVRPKEGFGCGRQRKLLSLNAGRGRPKKNKTADGQVANNA